MTEAEALTKALGGRWYGHYGLAFCPAHDNHRSPALHLATGERGQLLARCYAGCDFRDIVRAIRERGFFMAVHLPEKRSAGAERAPSGEDRLRQALRIWRASGSVAGTLTARYLARRAVRAPLPLSIRHARALWHPWLKRRLPAMVAALMHEAAGIVAIQRTWLRPPGRKCGAEPERAMLGPAHGGAVRLRGGNGRLIVGEGIETTLSIRDLLAEPEDRIWAALSGSGMKSLVLPRVPGRLIIGADDDEPGIGAAMSLAIRAAREGWSVEIAELPGSGLDWNDIAMTEAARPP